MNLRKNISWSILDFLVLPIGMILTVPIFLIGLGQELYGLYIFIASIIGVNALFNIGFGDTTVKYISHYIEVKNINLALQIHKTIMFCSLVAGFIAFILIFLNIENIKFAFQIDEITNVNKILLISSFILPLKLIESVYIATIRATGNYELAGKVTITSKILNLILMVFSVNIGLGLTGMMYSSLITCMCTILILYFFTYKFFNKNIFPAFNFKAFKNIYNFSGWSWVQGISGIFYANVDKFLISYIYDMKLLAFYGICLQVAQNLHSIYSAASHTIFPLVSRAYAKHGISKETKEIFRFADGAITLIACIPSVFLFFYAFEILNLWVGDQIADQSYKAFGILILVYCVFSANSISTFYIFNGIGRVKLQTSISLFSCIIMIISSLILIPIFGMIGAAFSRLPDTIVRVFFKTIAAKKILKIHDSRYAFDFLVLILINFIIIYFIDKFLLIIGITNILSSIAIIFITLILYAICSLYFGYLYHRLFSNWKSLKELIKASDYNFL